METPVAFFIYKRPELTEMVFAEIAAVKPKRLLVVADGPKTAGEHDLCASARAIIDRIDWDCSLSKEYSDVNLGCRRRVSSGLDWVFQQCDEAIILEDDILPHSSFFRFCEELLDKYRNDPRVMMIGGLNLQSKRIPTSYYFSYYTHIWGWASWKRAWKHYDVNMTSWPAVRDTAWLEKLLGDQESAAYWRDFLDRVYEGKVDTWDLQWSFACWSQNAFAVLPGINLIRNIGFTEGATHTLTVAHPLAKLQRNSMNFPLNHPSMLIRDVEADLYTFERYFRVSVPRSRNPLRRIQRKLSTIFR